MHPLKFPAVLKTEQDEWLEEGIAYISVEDKVVDFTNSFVPLMRLGTKVKIIRLEGDYETHCFEGEVYLSSKNLLRITSVSDHVLPDARQVLAVSTSVDTQLTPCESGFLAYTPTADDKIDVNIYSISTKEIFFTSRKTLEQGDKFMLTLEEPQLKRTVIEIYRSILFGSDSSLYLCKIINIADSSKESLIKFVEDMLKSQPQVFPPKQM